MRLLRVVTESVRALPDGAWSFAHPTTGEPFDLVRIIGPIGAGKTTLLEAIVIAKERAAGCGPPPDPRPLLRRGEPNGRVELTFLLSADERAASGLHEPIQPLEIRLSGAASSASIDPRVGKLLASLRPARLLYFPAARRLDPPEPYDEPASSRDEARLCVGRDADKFAPITRWLRERLAADAGTLAARVHDAGVVLAGDAKDSLAPFRAALASLCPHLRLYGLGPDGRTPWFEHHHGARVALGELSDAERDAVLLCGSCAMLSLSQPMVLVDRLDQAAPAERLGSWLDGLRALAPGGQVIFTSASDRDLPGTQSLRLEGAR